MDKLDAGEQNQQSQQNQVPQGLRLVDAMVSGVQPGVWEIRSGQELKKDGNPIHPGTFSANRQVIVDYTRDALTEGAVMNRIPLPDSRGAYTDVVAHIVLKDPMYPWNGSGGEDPLVPRVALLMLGEEELATTGGPRPFQTTVGQVLEKKQGVLTPDFCPVAEETGKNVCSAIQIPVQVFDRIAPKTAELPLLAHCRQVYIGDKAELDLHPEGMFSVVVCNRLAQYRSQGNNRYHLYLVSLEGCENYLDGKATGSGCDRIQLIVLDTWSFELDGAAPMTFRQFAERLVWNTADGGMLRLPSDQPRLKDGFVPMLYHARTGDEGICWYRSPFTPVVTARRERETPYYTEDGALVYDQETGIFDTSLAVAWQCGRLAALQDGVFAEQMMAVRRKGQELTDRLQAEGQILSLHGRPGNSQETGLSEKQRERLLEELDAMLDLPAAWLCKLNLFYQVPFYYLVPHEALLPMESLRFFYVDENWMTALTDGALSIAMDNAREKKMNEMIRSRLVEKTEEKLQGYRAGLYGRPAPEKRGEVISGVLIYSVMAKYWPSLSVQAVDREGRDLPVLRMQLLSACHLVILFDGIPGRIICEEPMETVQMKVEPGYREFRENSRIFQIDTGQWKHASQFARQFLTWGDRVIFERGGADGADG